MFVCVTVAGQGVIGEFAGGSEIRDQPNTKPPAQHDLHHHRLPLHHPNRGALRVRQSQHAQDLPAGHPGVYTSTNRLK